MLTTERERRICEVYSEIDMLTNRVGCSQCPLRKSNYVCKANGHYDRAKGYWVWDDEYVEKGA